METKWIISDGIFGALLETGWEVFYKKSHILFRSFFLAHLSLVSISITPGAYPF